MLAQASGGDSRRCLAPGRPLRTRRSQAIFRGLLILLLPVVGAPQKAPPGPDLSRALAAISADSLRGNLSFLASDLLEGRDTPSRGLDLAAEYIAAQFRKAGLEPAGGGGYFQTAKMWRAGAPADGFSMQLRDASRTLAIPGDQVMAVNRQALELSGVPLYKVRDAADLKGAELKGKAVELDVPAEDAPALAKAAAVLEPAAFLEISEATGPAARPLIDPEEERATFGDVPRLILRAGEGAEWLAEAGRGATGIRVSIRLGPPPDAPVTVRNVAAILRGSDPGLRERYVLLTAHYDHIGRSGGGEINPGANDDGSGTVSVIEIAQALAALAVHPKRSIVFLLFCGEEEGSLGARYYVRHPLFPLARTIAGVNLEQLGRTDSTAGPERSNATLTGFRYSSVTGTLREAGEQTGVKVYEARDDGDYFRRSDNLPFAERGIPSHTVVVAFDFPGYHGPGDVWRKIDYANMAKVDRMIALGAVLLANGAQPPHWNRNQPGAARYARGR